MKARIISALSVGTIAGFFVGLAISLHNSIANQYIHYNMLRSASSNLQESLNKWVVFSVIISLSLCVIPSLCLFAARLTSRLFPSDIIEVHVKDGDRLTRLVFVCALCSLLLLSGGWAVNHYWLPDSDNIPGTNVFQAKVVQTCKNIVQRSCTPAAFECEYRCRR
jgi:MFS family permease